MDVGRREQKKVQTRQALIASAMALFTEKGFDKTSVAEIAEKANCAPRTFFLYFDSKEDLVPAAIEMGSEQLRQTLAQHRPGKSTVDILQAWIRKGLANHSSITSVHDPALELRKHYYVAKYLRPVLAESFAEELGMDTTAPEPNMLAASATGLLNALSFDMTSKDRQAFLARTMTLLEQQIAAMSTK